MTGLAFSDHDAVPLNEFVQYVLPSIHNAPEDIAMHYIRVAAIEFARRVPVLKDIITIDSQAFVGDYQIPCINPQVTVYAVKSVSFMRNKLERLQYNPVQNQFTDSLPGYFFEAPSELFIRPTQRIDVQNGISVEVVLQPDQDATSLPLRFYQDYAHVLASGALNHLLLMKDSDWYDPKAAGINYKKFQNGMNTAKNLVLRGDSTNPVMARAPRWC